MKTLNFLIRVIILIMPLAVFSQSKNTDHLFLVNNQNYVGTLIEQKPGEYIKFIVKDSRDTLKIMMDDIDKIVKVEAGNQEKELNTKNQTIKPLKKQKIEFNQRPISLQIHYGLGGGDVSFTSLGLGLYRSVGSKSKIGLSASYFGETGYSPARLTQWQKIPVLAEYMFDLARYSNNRMAMYTRMGAGYSFTLNGTYYDPEKFLSFTQTNGLALHLGLGYRLNILKNSGLLFDINYSLIIDQNKSEDNLFKTKNRWDNVLFRAFIFI